MTLYEQMEAAEVGTILMATDYPVPWIKRDTSYRGWQPFRPGDTDAVATQTLADYFSSHEKFQAVLF